MLFRGISNDISDGFQSGFRGFSDEVFRPLNQILIRISVAIYIVSAHMRAKIVTGLQRFCNLSHDHFTLLPFLPPLINIITHSLSTH